MPHKSCILRSAIFIPLATCSTIRVLDTLYSTFNIHYVISISMSIIQAYSTVRIFVSHLTTFHIPCLLFYVPDSQYPRTIYFILIHTVYISALRFIFLHSSFRSTSCPGAYASPRILRSIFIETQRNKVEIRSRWGLGYATTARSLRFEPFLTRGTPAKKRDCTYTWQYQVKSNSRHTPTLVPWFAINASVVWLRVRNEFCCCCSVSP